MVEAEINPEPFRNGEDLSACNTHRQADCRCGTSAITSSRTCIESSRTRFWWQDVQKHLPLQEKETNKPCSQFARLACKNRILRRNPHG